MLEFVVAVAIRQYNPMMSNGFALGGFLTILYGISLNWYNFDETMKTVVTGAGLAALLGVAKYAYDR